MAGRSYPGTTAVSAAAMLAGAAGFWRIFTGGAWVVPVLVTVLGVQLLCWLMRQFNVNGWVMAAVVVIAVVLLSLWTVVPSSTTHGVPWVTTWHAARDAIDHARQTWSVTRVPVLPVTGDLLLAAASAGIATALADWSAFRVPSTLQGITPSVAVFALCEVLGGSAHRVVLTAVETAAVLTFLLVHRATVGRAEETWLGEPSPRRLVGTLGSGLLVVLVATFVAAGIGSQLPRSVPFGSRGQEEAREGAVAPRVQPTGPATTTTTAPLTRPIVPPTSAHSSPSPSASASGQQLEPQRPDRPVWLFVLLAVLVLLAGWIVANVVLRRIRWRRRRRGDGRPTPAYLVYVAWAELTETLGWWGQRRLPGETRTEFAQRAQGALATQVAVGSDRRSSAGGAGASSLSSAPTEVATLVDYAAFADEPTSATMANSAMKSSEWVTKELRSRASWVSRLVGLLDPRRSWAARWADSAWTYRLRTPRRPPA